MRKTNKNEQERNLMKKMMMMRRRIWRRRRRKTRSRWESEDRKGGKERLPGD